MATTICVNTRHHWMKVFSFDGTFLTEEVDYFLNSKSWGYELTTNKDVVVVYLYSDGSPKFNKLPTLAWTKSGEIFEDTSLRFPEEQPIYNSQFPWATEVFLDFDPYAEKKEKFLNRWRMMGYRSKPVKSLSEKLADTGFTSEQIEKIIAIL